MANTWEGLALQLIRVETALKRLTPPEPDDDFEAMRADTLKFHHKMRDHVEDKFNQAEIVEDQS